MEHFYKDIQGWFTFPQFYSTMAQKFQSDRFKIDITLLK